MATELAKAYVQIIPSAKNIKQSIEDALGDGIGSAGDSAGETFGSRLASMAKKVIAAAGIGKAISESLSAGADLDRRHLRQ